METNRNTQTPAAVTALTVIYKPAARLARITAAINRKPRSTDTRRAAYVITPNGEPQFITNTTSLDPIAAYGTTISALYDDAARRTSGTLLLLGKSGNPVPLNMLKDIPADMMLFKGEVWEAADAARAEHATRREYVEQYTRIINRISTTDEEREAAETERDMHRAEAANALAYATDTESRATAHTSSDTADLIQDCALEMVLHSRMSKAPAAVVRADVRKQRSGNAYQQPHTDIIRRATCEDKTQFTTFIDSEGRTIFEPMPYVGRKGSTDGYLCIEWRDATKERDAGFYLIHRRTTAAEYVSFTTLTEDGHEIADNNHGLNFILDQYDRAEIERTCDRANLNETERKAVFYVFDNITARNVLKAADESGEQTESLINRLWREALRRAGVLTAAKQDSTRADILTALDPDGRLTDAEKQRKKRMLDKLNKARKAIAAEEAAAAAAAHHADMLQFALDGISQSREGLTIAADTRAALDVLRWVEDYPTPEALTAEEVAAKAAAEAEAAAKSRRAYAADNLILAYRRAMRDHKPRRPAYAAHDALTAALVFFDSFSRTERLEVVAAATAAKAAKARAAYRAAYAEALQERTEAAAAETAFWTKAAAQDEKRSQSQSSRAAELTAAATTAAKAAAEARARAEAAAAAAEEAAAVEDTAAEAAARTMAAAAKAAATRAQRTADRLTAQATAAAAAAKDLQSESQRARAAAAGTTSRASAAAARDVAKLRRTAAKLTAYARLTAAEAAAE